MDQHTPCSCPASQLCRRWRGLTSSLAAVQGEGHRWIPLEAPDGRRSRRPSLRNLPTSSLDGPACTAVFTSPGWRIPRCKEAFLQGCSSKQPIKTVSVDPEAVENGWGEQGLSKLKGKAGEGDVHRSSVSPADSRGDSMPRRAEKALGSHLELTLRLCPAGRKG